MIAENDSKATDVATPGELDQLAFRLQGQLSGRVRHLQLVRQDDGIILRGFARTYYAKQIAQHAVMQHTRIPILTNEIVVA